MPRLLNVRLDYFSLYSTKKTITVAFAKGAFCLAGANGLGKSTFLAVLNFGLTGIVADPNRKFESVVEYYNHSLDFAGEFFDGRVHERDRERAQVSVDFKIGDNIFHVTRGFFEREHLRAFRVRNTTGLVEGPKASRSGPSGRHQEYVRILPHEIGVDSFEQFVFLQQFVFTFDERRHLLFWDDDVLGQALHLCFGLNPSDADRADTLRREKERADSRVRNFQWDATELQKRVEQLESIDVSGEEGKDAEEIVSQHKKLVAQREDAKKLARKVADQRQDAEMLFAKMTAQVATLNGAYEKAFEDYVKRNASPSAHPLIKGSMEDRKCGICATEGAAVVDNIRSKLNSGFCPLCNSAVAGGGRAPTLLKEIDSNLADAKVQLKEITTRKDRLDANLTAALKVSNDFISGVDKFEQEHASLLALEPTRDASAIQRTIAGFREQINNLLLKKEAELERREAKLKKLRQLQRKLVAQYSEAEGVFVPIFRDLANSFLGIELNVQLEQAKSGGVSLTLSVRDTPRRDFFQLSESQRFFVDIALRMALLKFTSPPNGQGSLLLDTPEGALDIAYEKRAGDMFARFVLDGFSLILTANINTSQLLLALAYLCGTSHMRLCRMTSWTELSEVQLQEEGLFNKAYQQINRALSRGTRRKLRSAHA